MIKGLVARQVPGDTAEAEAKHLLVEDSDGDEEMAEQWDSALSTALWDATPSTSEEEGGEHEK